YKDRQSPDKGTHINDDQITDLVKIVSPYTEWIRTYGCTNGLENIGKIAHKAGLKIAAGAWLSGDTNANEVQIANLISASKAGEVDVAIVGSEVLHRGDLNATQLINYIDRVKAAVPGIPVTTADVDKSLLDDPDVMKATDVLFVHIYPYWAGIKIDSAIGYLNAAYDTMVAHSDGKEVIIAETGWPSEGGKRGMAVPSEDNAATYFLNFTSWAKTRQVKYFYFEAFDEAWKSAHEGAVGAHWGIWNSNGKSLKPGIQTVFLREGK
ncbi:MAG TPA: glycosyl hydrolase family 17 protein, partial [Bacteroidia bacterium]|nr:glycosyl hydrolase family 17 protein [Bacteroidia bacterium]